MSVQAKPMQPASLCVLCNVFLIPKVSAKLPLWQWLLFNTDCKNRHWHTHLRTYKFSCSPAPLAALNEATCYTLLTVNSKAHSNFILWYKHAVAAVGDAYLCCSAQSCICLNRSLSPDAWLLTNGYNSVFGNNTNTCCNFSNTLTGVSSKGQILQRSCSMQRQHANPFEVLDILHKVATCNTKGR